MPPTSRRNLKQMISTSTYKPETRKEDETQSVAANLIRWERTGRLFHIKRRVQSSTKGFPFEEKKKNLNCFAPGWPWRELSDKSQGRSGQEHAANVAFCAKKMFHAPTAAWLNIAEGEESSGYLCSLVTFPHTFRELRADQRAR